MYRAVTWAALERRVPINDEAAVTALAEQLEIHVSPPTVDDGRQYTVTADDEDVTWLIRSEDVEANVSPVSAYPGVRHAMVKQQRRIAGTGQVVMVGRDIGTVVLPNADLKIYLDASVETRARRRWFELTERGGETPYEDVLAAMHRRDEIDSTREASPLSVPADAVMLDSTHLDVNQTLAQVLRLVEVADCPAG